MEQEKLSKFTELETKYLTTLEMLLPFKAIAEGLPGLISFEFGQGPDYFFENVLLPNTFVRFRKSDYPDRDGKHFQQLTSKTKINNNRERQEPNLAVGGSLEEAFAFIESVGFKFTHSIRKSQIHIYRYPDCTAVFYTIQPSPGADPEHFVEFEVDEATIHTFTRDEASSVIEKYEKHFAVINGVSAKKRLRLSLRERYMPKNEKTS